MNASPRRFLVLGLIALVPMLAAAATRNPLNPEETMKQIERRLRDVRKKIDAELGKKDPEAHRKALGYIQTAEAQFRMRKESFAGSPNYPIEAEYLGRSFKELILDSFTKVVKIMQEKDSSVRNMRMNDFVINAKKEATAFDLKFQRDHPDDVRAAVVDRAKLNDWPLPDPKDDERILTDFKEKAPLVATGGKIFDDVISGVIPSVPNPTTPGSPGGSSPSTGSGGSAPDWGSIIRRVATVGVPNELAASAGAALNAGRHAEALALARSALELDPKNQDALGVVHSVQGRGDALDAAKDAMNPAKAGAAAFAPAGFAGEGAGAGRASSEAASAALAASAVARASAAQAENAKSALRLGDNRSALEALDKALAQDPNNPALLSLRAQTYGNLGRWEEALRDAAKGLALAPGSMALMRTKALAENRTRRYRDALETSERMIAADPRGAWGYGNRAHAWAGLGNRDAMLADIGRASSLDPSFQRAAADAALLQLPSDADVMFLFPGEAGAAAAAPAAAPPGRARRFGVVAGAAVGGGLLLALGLLSLVLAPLKNSVVAVFTRSGRRAPDTASSAAPVPAGAVTGSVIRGQYEISRQIGAGGMGMVYEGTDRSLGRRVAIKKMREELRLNARERDRFVIEAQTVASLHHPNIVDIYAIAEEGTDVYLVFEYVDGKTVHDLVQKDGRLGVAEAVSITRSMGEALTYAHSRGVIHRDMKPSNVMLTNDGAIKVMDFGIARMAKDAMTRYSMTNTVVGTPPYMAPEQEQGVVRKESDVYSLAICAYEMFTGKLPFIGIGAGMLMNKINMSYIPPSRNIAGLPEALDDVFLKAFQADPERRYRTPQEFVTALAGAADGARRKSV